MAGAAFVPSNIDPDHQFGWGENIGWTNWRHGLVDAGDGAVVEHFVLSGLVWAENVGWINLSDATHFVSVGPCQVGDMDCDGDIDIHDHEDFVRVFNGPNVTTDCPAADANSDLRIDLFDAARLQRDFSGGP